MDLEEVMGRGGITKDLGMEFVSLEPEEVVATMPVDARHHQPLGFLHGGVSVTLAESVATVGGWLNCAPGKVAFGSEINASHLRPKRSGALTAVGRPLHRGRGSQVWQVEIRDEDEKLVCVSRCTLAVMDAPE